MITASEFALGSGALMGLASSLHCTVMCGGIASTLTLSGGAGPTRLSFRPSTLLLPHVGRIFSYVAAGALVGATGSTFIGALDQHTAYRVLQWAAAMTLAAMGLSLAGILPPLALTARIVDPIVRRLTSMGADRAPRLVAGAIWGFLPCSMAYSALFAAAFTGDALHGAMLMAGFGIGTLPALLGVVFVVGRWATRARGVGRQAAGLVIAGFAAVTLILAQPGGPLCVGP